MAANFDKYLDVQLDSIEQPVPPPIGRYHATIKKWKTGERNYGPEAPKVPILTFLGTITGPADDEDEYDGDPADAQGKPWSKDYRLDTQSHSIRRVIEVVGGVDPAKLKMSDGLNAIIDAEVRIDVDHRTDKNDETVVYMDVKKILPVSDE